MERDEAFARIEKREGGNIEVSKRERMTSVCVGGGGERKS